MILNFDGISHKTKIKYCLGGKRSIATSIILHVELAPANILQMFIKIDHLITFRTPLIILGWTIFAHPLFLDQVQALVDEVKIQKQKNISSLSLIKVWSCYVTFRIKHIIG